MSQVITDEKLLENIAEFLNSNSAFNQFPLDYCKRASNLNEGACKYSYTLHEGLVVKGEHETYSVFAFGLKELEDIIINSKTNTRTKTNTFKQVRAYQEILTCEDHYEDLLQRVSRTLGWTTLARDKPNDPLQAEGIWDCPFGVSGSLVFTPYGVNEPRVFAVERGIVTPSDITYDQFIENPPVSEAEFKRALKHKTINEKLNYDKFLENLLGLTENEWEIIKKKDQKIVDFFIKAYALKEVYLATNGSIRPS